MSKVTEELADRIYPARTVEPLRGSGPHLNAAAPTAENVCRLHYPRTVEANSAEEPRSEASRRGEAAYREWAAIPPSQRPLSVGRQRAAALLDEEMHAAWVAGEERASNVCVANALGVDERMVREYRDGRRYLPLGAVFALPHWLASRLLARVQDDLGFGDRLAASALRKALDGLRASVTRGSADELRRVVRDARKQLMAIEEMLDEVSK